MHDWPLLFIMPTTPRVTAASSSASSRTMFGDLPPSSCATRLTVGAAFLATSIPARVEPVKLTMSTSGWLLSAAPTVGPSPLTRLKTPAGTPAACITSVHSWALNGAISEGFNTIVQPTARAGTTLHAIWLIGQFHGVMNAQTPIGSFVEHGRAAVLLEPVVLQHLDPGHDVAHADRRLRLHREPAGGPHLLGDRRRDVRVTLLILGEDVLEELDPVLAGGRARRWRTPASPPRRRRRHRRRCPSRWSRRRLRSRG